MLFPSSCTACIILPDFKSTLWKMANSKWCLCACISKWHDIFFFLLDLTLSCPKQTAVAHRQKKNPLRFFYKLFPPTCFLLLPLITPLLPDSGVLVLGPDGVPHTSRPYFLWMGSSRPLYGAEWSGRYTLQISPSSPCHLLPLTEPNVSELQLIHLSCALISIAAAKEFFAV